MYKGTDLSWIEAEALMLVKKHWGIDFIPNIVFDRSTDEEWDNNFGKDDDKCTLLGVYWSKDMTIEFNTKQNSKRTLAEIKKTLLHELCHWYLHYNELPYHDSDVRFGHELIRTGLRPNTTPAHYNAYKEAKKDTRYHTFELVDNGEEKIVTRLCHKRKDQNDFKKDLKDVMKRLKAEFIKQQEEYEKGEYDSVDDIWVGEVVGALCEWHGYEEMEYPIYSIVIGNENGRFEDEDDFNSVIDSLTNIKYV
ncbi:SprT-like domain-containing protein [Lysinibacillus sp. 1P01SD]|uniref:SprT-like domain-containing protein n=1 Tax=Lysinibacillus sp. 1P01SD TaxID=3132285 RepID=UPI0039A3E5DF